MNQMSFPRDGRTIAPVEPRALSYPAPGDDSARGVPLVARYFNILRRRKWPLLGCIIACAAAGLIVTLMMTPLYTATSTIEIQREGQNIVQVEGVEPETSSVDMEFYQTQYGLLRAQSLAERVATDLKLFDSPAFFANFEVAEAEAWFEGGRVRSGASTRQQRIRRAGEVLLDNLTVSPARLSRLVDISFTGPDPVLSARVVDAWATHFIQQSLERRFEATSYARRFLEERLEQLRQRLEASERRLVAYAQQQGIINIPVATGGENGGTGERSIVAEDLGALNQELSRAVSDRVKAESRLSTGGEVAESLQNEVIGGLRQRRAELASEYSRLMVQFEPAYPPARALASQIQQLDSAIRREETRVRSALQETYRASAAREADLSNRVDGLKSDLLDLRRRSIQFNIFQRDVDTNRELYQGLLQRYKEIGVAGGVGTNNISIVDKAKVPQDPSSPNLVLNILLSILVGGLAGIGLALALEQIDEAIADPADVERDLALPLLGTVPKVQGGTPAEALKDRKSAVAEAYLSVQTNLAFSTDHGVPRTLAVTSTRPAEGKTTSSYAIATSLARGGRKVLLVDADMRSPSIHTLFELPNNSGFSNYLAGDDDYRRLISDVELPGLSVMSAGPQPPSAAELLAGDRLSVLVTRLLEDYDHVIFDAPPVMGLADAPLIGSRSEGTIFVIESHGTKTSMAKVAVTRLRSANVQLLGTVLTKFESKRAHYGYGYDYGYSYGEATTKAS